MLEKLWLIQLHFVFYAYTRNDCLENEKKIENTSDQKFNFI